MGKCKNCKNFKDVHKHDDGFLIGVCGKEPFDVRDMTSNQAAVQCGHDGYISVGEDFGCVNFEAITMRWT